MSEKYLIKLSENETNPLSIRAKVLVFEDPISRDLLQKLRKIAPSNANVVIMGETGTGKELLAREVHRQSSRSDKAFIAVNCGAFSENLIESELFGHEKGAFTGAHITKQGWFEEANGGSLFLDEIGDMPYALQIKLLRVIQERQVVRLGGRKTINIDVRLIVATNVKLEEAVAAGRFREDLYYRLNVVNLQLLPLRDRPKDILPLLEHFLEVYSKRLSMKNRSFSDPALKFLIDEYAWPGNIRELENVVHQAILVSQGNVIQIDDLNLSGKLLFSKKEEDINRISDASGSELLKIALTKLYTENPEKLHETIDKTIMETAFNFSFRNQMETARLLGISRNIVRSKLIQYDIFVAKSQKKGD